MKEFISNNSYVIAMCFGVAAMIEGIITYQSNKHKNIMMFMVLNALLWSCHYVFLGLYTPIAMNLINVVRNVVYSFRDKKWAQNNIIPAVFVVISLGLGIATWESAWSALPMIATVLFSIGCWCKDTKKLRLLSVPASLSWMVYNLANKSLPGFLNEIFVVVSIIVAFIRYDINKSDKKSKNTVENR